MVAERIQGPLTREEMREMRLYEIIYSVDVTRNSTTTIEDLDPNRIPRRRDKPVDNGLWFQTEGDEQYEYDYLADEFAGQMCRNCGGTGIGYEGSTLIDAPGAGEPDTLIYGVGIESVFRFGDTATIYESRPCSECRGTGNGGEAYRDGHHAKWVATLTHEQFLELANDRSWELDEDEFPADYTETMGMLTFDGVLPAVAVNDEEGWGYDGNPIYAQFYVSAFILPVGATSTIKED